MSGFMLPRVLSMTASHSTPLLQGLVPDPTLLDTSEVELVDLKFLEEEPIVVAQFTCQQINCTRDAFGNVVDGQPDEVQR